MILTSIGEVGVKAGADHYRLRPSLYAISQLGTPVEIVELYGRLMGDGPTLADALHVINCCTEDDLSAVFGAVVPDGSSLRFQEGAATLEDTVHIARALLRHGVTGALPPEERRGDQEEKEGDYVAGFDARANAAMAMAHLGASTAQAWAMTMTELVGALRAKFPPMPELDAKGKPKPKRMTEAEYDAVMDYGDAVMAALAAKG